MNGYSIYGYNTYVYKIVEYRRNKEQHQFGLYPVAKGEIVQVLDCADGVENIDDGLFYMHSTNVYSVGDTLHFEWSRDYGFGLSNGKDYYIRYIFVETATLRVEGNWEIFTK